MQIFLEILGQLILEFVWWRVRREFANPAPAREPATAYRLRAGAPDPMTAFGRPA